MTLRLGRVEQMPQSAGDYTTLDQCTQTCPLGVPVVVSAMRGFCNCSYKPTVVDIFAFRMLTV